jgi:hypothetical protein
MITLKQDVSSLISRFDAAQEAFAANTAKLRIESSQLNAAIKNVTNAAGEFDFEAIRLKLKLTEINSIFIGFKFAKADAFENIVDDFLNGKDLTAKKKEKLLFAIYQQMISLGAKKSYLLAIKLALKRIREAKSSPSCTGSDCSVFPIFITQRKYIDLIITRKKVSNVFPQHSIFSPLPYKGNNSFDNNENNQTNKAGRAA